MTFIPQAHADDMVRLGVLAKRGEEVTITQWAHTAVYLTNEIDGYIFDIIPLDFEALTRAVRDGEIDFVITNTASYVELQYLYGISRIATLINKGPAGEHLTQFGSVIFTRRDSPVTLLSDLKNKTFGAVDKTSFGGWIMAQKELLNQGISRRDFTEVKFFGSHDNVVNAVAAMTVDAGTVRSDTLERMAKENLIDLSDFKILAAKYYSNFPFKVSTELYPEWPFAKLSHTSDALAGKVVVTLLRMPKDSYAAQSADIIGWTTPLDYSKVHRLLQELQFGPFAQQTKEIVLKDKEVSFSELFSIQEFIFLGLLLLLACYLTYRFFRYRGLLNIKLSLFNILLIAFEFGVISFLIYEVLVLDRLENNLASGYEQQNEMIRVADRLRQSSDDLTHFARTYVVTGDIRFKQRYYTTLDIRNGQAPRPENYNDIYWDLNQLTRQLRHPTGKTQALKTLFKTLPFSSEELAMLQRAENNSNNLSLLEEEAFTAMMNGHKQQAINLLHSNSYYDAKHQIMLPIDKMLELLRKRTNAENTGLLKKINNQIRLLLVVGFIFLACNLIVYLLLCKKINAPIAYLTNVIKCFERGQENVEEKTFHNDEIGYMIHQFFKMHDTLDERTREVQQLLQRTQESIDYAAFIQRALIPRSAVLQQYFVDFFTIWEPRDSVGGDIFLCEEISHDNEVLLMVIDCTGHGVPGALMTMLVKAIERQMVETIKRSDEFISPAKLLSIFNHSIKDLLHQEHTDTIANVGFDGSVLYYNKSQNLIRYAGAQASMIVDQENHFVEIKGDRQSVGYKNSDKDFVFTDHELQVTVPTVLYLMTDGYMDQIGGIKGLPFGKKRLLDLISAHGSQPLPEQETLFLETLSRYQGEEKRNDDITLIALKIKPYET